MVAPPTAALVLRCVMMRLFAHPFSHAFTRALRRAVRLEEPGLGILTTQGFLWPQMKREETNYARGTVFLCSGGSVGLLFSVLKERCTAGSERESASLKQGSYFQRSLHLLTADRLDKTNTQKAVTRPANNSTI